MRELATMGGLPLFYRKYIQRQDPVFYSPRNTGSCFSVTQGLPSLDLPVPRLLPCYIIYAHLHRLGPRHRR